MPSGVTIDESVMGENTFWQIFKRLVLVFLTILTAVNIAASLIQSLNQPQVQSRLELYQTNLILQAAEFQGDGNTDVAKIRTALLGENLYQTAQKQYKQALQTAQTHQKTLQARSREFVNSPKNEASREQEQQWRRELQETTRFVDEIELKIGILQAQQGKTEKALETWDNLIESPQESAVAPMTALVRSLWSASSLVPANAEETLMQNLKGWFRDRALHQLYQVQQNDRSLFTLQAREQTIARQAVLKLAIVSIIPTIGGFLGVGLLLFLLIQLAIQKEKSLLATHHNLTWDTPWDLEVIWQVFIVGFFFIGQFILPTFFGFLGLEPTGFSLRQKALFVLSSYLLMAIGGFLVLYFSLKPFFPLPKDWFRFKWLDKWALWGFGGYLIAIPLVVIVSLVNQQFWQGQGGSNPILFLALQAQDTVALAIFFFTASIAAPVFEEVIFRGFLLPSLTRYMPLWGAIGVSSLVFAIAHLSFSEVLPLATLGIILGIVYARSRNLLASILLHSLWNSGTLLSLFILGS
ncbi:CPBP family glutamic-type intramembrane protease [Lusitaniella coriacea]|nr:CPBP family glutamic-type intramembrane protease [Lusitaniella coriacea]